MAFKMIKVITERENPNKTLEGIKTGIQVVVPVVPPKGENPNKTLEGIKTG
ncbi:hypothetical protein U27_01430 [Candidatus Vecturithrix granuli]|uniref:Uncharacterized protein n=1 Tax=Vecturithrix granuli TaxID=1499967 RepID=A0A081CAC4_VECG1|nr:hypothetical protein U27_01430 [Candidatus Vecturithrix granuli]